MLAFRRQHHQEIATQNTDFDATERRITELYTRAVEQLGDDKAPVRLGGLYALERLAQDNDAQRQTIVNVICAYLRMPFPATPDITTAPIPGGEGTREGTKTAAAPSMAGDTWQQEKQVRLTAQRILSEHLHQPDTSQNQVGTSSSRFWADVRLDLTGATLIDFGLHQCTVTEAQFRGATFSGDAWFGEATFSGDAWFDEATFSGDAWFGEATFSGDAWFDEATFSGDAWFGGATFGRDGRFDGATFNGTARFSKATLNSTARFSKATFNSTTWFDEATFNNTARFDGATFNNTARFDEATFNGDAGFDGAAFNEDAIFDWATFNRTARFGEATFNGDARFGEAAFNRRAIFDGATFNGTTWFGEAPFHRDPRWFINGAATFELGPDALSFRGAVATSGKLPHKWPEGWQLSATATGTLTITRTSSNTTKS